MKSIFQILIFTLAYCSYGQDKIDRYDIDFLQLFSEDQLTYQFNLNSASQGLFFDSLIYKDLPRIKLEVFNRTNDTIIWKYKEHDDHLMWLRTGSWRDTTLLPNESFELRSAWPSYRHVGPINSDIDIQYQIKGVLKNCRIHTWGELYPKGFSDNKVNIEENIIEYVDTINIDQEKTQPTIITPNTNGVFFYYTQNKREYIEPLDSFGTYKHHVYLKDLSEIGLNAELLRSYLQSNGIEVSISNSPETILTSDDNDFLILCCKSEDIERIGTLLKGTAIHFIIDSKHYRNNRFLDDTYDLYFSSNLDWSEDDVETFLKANGIKNYKGLRKTNNEFPMKYSYFVEVTLDNKYQHSEQDLINRLVDMPEVSWISSGRKTYVSKD